MHTVTMDSSARMEKLSEMDVSTGEYCKMEKWIDALIKIPFGKYTDLPINNSNKDHEKRNTKQQMELKNGGGLEFKDGI